MGNKDHPLYGIWAKMKQRCYNPYNHKYDSYGGRGIVVCDRWKNDFWAFVKDMGPRPEGTSIDRIDNDGNYTPENCRWATSYEQSRNRRDNDWITYNGKTLVLRDWAREINLNHITLYSRIYDLGWSVGQALGFEPRPNNYKGRIARKHKWNGGQYTLKEIAKISGIKYGTLKQRLSRGYSLEDIRPLTEL